MVRNVSLVLLNWYSSHCQWLANCGLVGVLVRSQVQILFKHGATWINKHQKMVKQKHHSELQIPMIFQRLGAKTSSQKPHLSSSASSARTAAKAMAGSRDMPAWWPMMARDAPDGPWQLQPKTWLEENITISWMPFREHVSIFFLCVLHALRRRVLHGTYEWFGGAGGIAMNEVSRGSRGPQLDSHGAIQEKSLPTKGIGARATHAMLYESSWRNHLRIPVRKVRWFHNFGVCAAGLMDSTFTEVK